jgi:Uma2 family endonuclease
LKTEEVASWCCGGKIERMTTLLPVDVNALPRNLVLEPPLSDAEFEALCRANDLVHFERTRKGVIRMNPPRGGLASDGNAEIIAQLRNWWKGHRRGRVFDSNAGFYLSDGSALSPDAAYVLPGKLQGLTKADLTGFPRLCPDFVIELLSASVNLAEAQEKMGLWIANGATLGCLVDPNERKVYHCEPGREASAASGKSVSGIGPVQGFSLDLDEVWRCYEV